VILTNGSDECRVKRRGVLGHVDTQQIVEDRSRDRDSEDTSAEEGNADRKVREVSEARTRVERYSDTPEPDEVAKTERPRDVLRL
jgi:hypothetical protein